MNAFLNRIGISWQKPLNEKKNSCRYRFKILWNRLFPFTPLLTRVSYGAWWLAVNDVNNDGYFSGNYEPKELRFVKRFLKPGMVVVDIGAHHGFYTLYASKLVGDQGLVIAFEPSVRELQKLRFHINLNRCKNVKVAPFALSNSEETTDFYVVMGRDTGCNSLRTPVVTEPIERVQVQTSTLDSYLNRTGVQKVDFIKLDAEGAELKILNGASHLLNRFPRPIILCELSEGRCLPWGHTCKDIIDLLEKEYNYRWCSLGAEGSLGRFLLAEGIENYVAVPVEYEIDTIQN